MLGLEAASADDLYEAIDWVLARQGRIEAALAPLLFEDDDKAAADAQRKSVVAPAQRSPRALRKVQISEAPRRSRTLHADDRLPVHSFRTLLADLATLTKNKVRYLAAGGAAVEVLATPTPVQQRAFDLLQVSPLL